MIIIGSGAGGGTLVRHLAPSGKRILLLERGDWLPREPQNWHARGRLRRQPLRLARTPGTTSDGKPFQPQVHYFVGGATKLYGAALYRLREEDFGELRHHDGISPAWPIGYDEMEPYYTQAEQLYQVHGARGEDPTEPPASAPYPFPAVSPRAAHPAALRRPRRGRAATRSTRPAASCSTRRNMPYSACVRCATCDGFPCLVHAKSDAEVLGVRPALEHPNVTLLTNAEAVRAGDQRGRHARSPASWSSATARARRSRGDIVVVSCGAANSRQAAARLGQRRAPATGWPTAPTRSGATTCSTTARPCWRCRKEPNPTVFQKTLGLNDFYFGGRRLRLPDGQHPDGRQVVGGDVPRREAAARRSSRRAGRCDDVARHAVDFWLSTEDLPRPENRVTLDARRQHRARLHGRPTRSPRSGCYHELKSMLEHLGHAPRPPAPAPRLPEERDPGRRRARTRPAPAASAPTRRRSVLDADCRAHELDNLYVVDTSFFPSIGAVNPALTAMANALRVGDHLLERMRRPRDRTEPAHVGDLTRAAAARRHRRRRLRRRSAARSGWPSTTTSASR